VKDIGAAEVVCADPAKMTIKDSGAAEVVHADDAETSLKDSGKSETMLTDVPSRITPEEVSKAGSETVCGDPEEVTVEASLENNSGSEEVVVEAGVEESKTADGKNYVPGHEGTEDVAFAISDCRRVSEATYQHMLVGKEGDAMQVGDVEETVANGGDPRLGCKEIQSLSLAGGAVPGFVTETCDLQAGLVYNDAGSSGSLLHAVQSHEDAITTWPQNRLKGLPAVSQASATGASMASF